MSWYIRSKIFNEKFKDSQKVTKAKREEKELRQRSLMLYVGIRLYQTKFNYIMTRRSVLHIIGMFSL